jgi:shikimate kinase
LERRPKRYPKLPTISAPSRDELTALLRAREPLYSQAELVADTSKHSADEVVEMIAQRFPSEPGA